MDNFFDFNTRTATDYVEGVIKEIKKKAAERARRFEEQINQIG